MFDDKWFRQHRRETRLKMWIVCALGLLSLLAQFLVP